MNYAIETLRIEEYRLKDQLRTIEKNCDEARDIVGDPDGVQANLQSIEKAIKVLERKEQIETKVEKIANHIIAIQADSADPQWECQEALRLCDEIENPSVQDR